MNSEKNYGKISEGSLRLANCCFLCISVINPLKLIIQNHKPSKCRYLSIMLNRKNNVLRKLLQITLNQCLKIRGHNFIKQISFRIEKKKMKYVKKQKIIIPKETCQQIVGSTGLKLQKDYRNNLNREEVLCRKVQNCLKSNTNLRHQIKF